MAQCWIRTLLTRDMTGSALAICSHLSRLARAAHWEAHKRVQPGKLTRVQMPRGSEIQVTKRFPPYNYRLTLASWVPPSIALCSRTIPTYSLPEKWQKSSQVWLLSFLYSIYTPITSILCTRKCRQFDLLVPVKFCSKTDFMVRMWERNDNTFSHWDFNFQCADRGSLSTQCRACLEKSLSRSSRIFPDENAI